MKITFVTYRADLSGGSRVIAVYADILSRRGHDVCVVSQPHPRPSLRMKLRSLRRTGQLSPRPQGPHHFSPPGINYRAIDTVRPITNEDLPDADVVIATWWETAYWVAALAPQKGKKFYFIQHHEVHDHLPWQISRGSYYLPLKKITISRWLVDIMAREYADTDVALVHNSVDMNQFHAPPRERQAAPTVGLLYSPTRFKGVDISLKAVAKAQEQIPDLRLVAFGARDPVPGLPLPSNSHYHRNPAQNTIREIYAACDVWLLGSRTEGFGLPILEAMACRTPVVATRAGAAPDLIRNGVNGHVVDIEDAGAMADRIVQVLTLSPNDWRTMSDAALAVAEGYTWEDAATLFERTLMAEQPAPSDISGDRT